MKSNCGNFFPHLIRTQTTLKIGKNRFSRARQKLASVHGASVGFFFVRKWASRSRRIKDFHMQRGRNKDELKKEKFNCFCWWWRWVWVWGWLAAANPQNSKINDFKVEQGEEEESFQVNIFHPTSQTLWKFSTVWRWWCCRNEQKKKQISIVALNAFLNKNKKKTEILMSQRVFPRRKALLTVNSRAFLLMCDKKNHFDDVNSKKAIHKRCSVLIKIPRRTVDDINATVVTCPSAGGHKWKITIVDGDFVFAASSRAMRNEEGKANKSYDKLWLKYYLL